MTETRPTTWLPNGDWIPGHAIAAIRAGIPRADVERALADKFGLAPPEVAWVIRFATDCYRRERLVVESAA